MISIKAWIGTNTPLPLHPRVAPAAPSLIISTDLLRSAGRPPVTLVVHTLDLSAPMPRHQNHGQFVGFWLLVCPRFAHNHSGRIVCGQPKVKERQLLIHNKFDQQKNRRS
jgi:hypothetical protein